MTSTAPEGGTELTGMTYSELAEWVTAEMGMKPYRAGQLFTWIHQKRVGSFQKMTDISMEARRLLETMATLTVLEPDATLTASDGTVKHRFTLEDGETIESVLIPDGPRLTACLSTQAGCRCGCVFCQTGLGGYSRNLSSAEMVGQLYSLQENLARRITNVVFMGMGEPMDNFPNLAKTLSIISDDRGICIGARKITISTVGLPGSIRKLCSLGGQYGLAISLHSAVEEKRRMLVPVSAALPLKRLRQDMMEYNTVTGRRVTLEYCLIAGINDSIEDARALAEFAEGIQCKINLLVYNPVDGVSLRRPNPDSVESFMRYLYPRCQAVTLRRSRGVDIAAACGQLGAPRRTGNQ